MGFFDRLRSAPNLNFSRTTIKQHFNITVPAAHATVVQSAIEGWAASKGWAAIVNATTDGDKVKLSLEHDESMPGSPPKIDASEMSEELQRVIQDAIKQEQA